MSILRTRRTLVAAAVAGTAIAGALGAGTAAHAATSGIIVRQSCTGVSGNINYVPGLQSTTAQSNTAVLSATLTGCSGVFSGPLSGNGSFAATLQGNASAAAENFTGTFTINWPASAALNPSNGTLTVTEVNGMENVSGTVKSGALVGSPISFSYIPTSSTTKTMTVSSTSSKSSGHNSKKKHTATVTVTTAQAFINTMPLQLTQNEG